MGWIVLLSIILFVSIVINILTIKLIIVNIAKIEVYERWILGFKKDVEVTHKKLKDIDDRQIFEKDDEVGFVFKNLVNIINRLKTKIVDENYEESQEQEEN